LTDWRIPLADVDIEADELKAVHDVLQSKWLSMGSVTEAFEAAFAEFLGGGHCVAVANGTAALHLACLALEVGVGDEVVVPALTFVASANAIVYTGATPVFADISDADDLNVAAAAVEARITSRTKAIMVMHYGGFMCDMDAVLDVARRHRLSVIEDAAHAPGARGGRHVAGTAGDIGCFSFFANKNMTTGEGGMIAVRDPRLADRLRRLRSHGMTSLTWDRHRGHASSYDVVDLGYNYRLGELQAALGLCQLRKLQSNNRRRATITVSYREALRGADAIGLPFRDSDEGTSSYHLFPIVLDPQVDRAAFVAELRRRRIQTSMHYPPVHLFSYYRRRFATQEGNVPRTEDVARRQVTLPLYPSMSPDDVSTVTEGVLAALQCGRA
jgi:dTDP-4-amino-4,6-dideoxygalactose transaminase